MNLNETKLKYPTEVYQKWSALMLRQTPPHLFLGKFKLKFISLVKVQPEYCCYFFPVKIAQGSLSFGFARDYGRKKLFFRSFYLRSVFYSYIFFVLAISWKLRNLRYLKTTLQNIDTRCQQTRLEM